MDPRAAAYSVVATATSPGHAVNVDVKPSNLVNLYLWSGSYCTGNARPARDAVFLSPSFAQTTPHSMLELVRA